MHCVNLKLKEPHDFSNKEMPVVLNVKDSMLAGLL